MNSTPNQSWAVIMCCFRQITHVNRFGIYPAPIRGGFWCLSHCCCLITIYYQQPHLRPMQAPPIFFLFGICSACQVSYLQQSFPSSPRAFYHLSTSHGYYHYHYIVFARSLLPSTYHVIKIHPPDFNVDINQSKWCVIRHKQNMPSELWTNKNVCCSSQEVLALNAI